MLITHKLKLKELSAATSVAADNSFNFNLCVSDKDTILL